MQTEQLIEQLTAELAPVRVLRAPALRAPGLADGRRRVSAALILRFSPLDLHSAALGRARVAIECVATALTAVTAILAAFELSIPDRSPRWALAAVAVVSGLARRQRLRLPA